MLKKIDLKTVIIVILMIFLILTLLNKIGTKYDYKQEINKLHESNRELIYKYDSIEKVNKRIDIELERIYGIIEITEKLIIQYDNNINELKKSKNETTNRVNLLNADGVATEFTNYLKKRRSKNVR
jgi:hypothetical protein